MKKREKSTYVKSINSTLIVFNFLLMKSNIEKCYSFPFQALKYFEMFLQKILNHISVVSYYFLYFAKYMNAFTVKSIIYHI